MACTLLQVDNGQFSVAGSWVEGVAATVSGRSVTITGSGLEVSFAGKTLNHSKAGSNLHYMFFGASGNLLILDSYALTSSGSNHDVSLIDFTGSFLVEKKLFSYTAKHLTTQPIVHISRGSASVILILVAEYNSLDKLYDVSNISVYRSDNASQLITNVPSGTVNKLDDITAEYIDPIITIDYPPNAPIAKRFANLAITPPSAKITDFKAVVGGAPDSRDFTLTNPGPDCLQVTSVAEAGPVWKVTSGSALPAHLAPGESLKVTVQYNPAMAGPTPETALPVACIPAQEVLALGCKGVGLERKIGFEPQNLILDFGLVAKGTQKEMHLRIRNDGEAPLNVDVSGPIAGSPFQWTAWTGLIDPASFKNIDIAFTPTAVGAVTGSLTVKSDASTSASLLSIKGEGIIPPVLKYDLFIRDNLEDDGSEPLRGGNISASPDIILRNKISLDPQGDFGAPDAMTKDDLSQLVEKGQDNFIYLRVQNRGPGDGSGTASVYWAKPSTLPQPKDWTRIGASVSIPAVKPGSVAVVGPVVWRSIEIPEIEHYCFVAIIDSTDDKAPDHTSISSIDAYYRLIREKNNVTWKNFDVIDAVAGSKRFLHVDLSGGPHRSIQSDLKIDVGALPSDATVSLRLSRHLLDRAFFDGVTLAQQSEREAELSVTPARTCRLAGMSLGASKVYRAVLEIVFPEHAKGNYLVSLSQEVSGLEMGRVSAQFFVADFPLIANSGGSKEIHSAECSWLGKMNPHNRIPYRDIVRAIKDGYNGCRYCLPAYSTD